AASLDVDQLPLSEEEKEGPKTQQQEQHPRIIIVLLPKYSSVSILARGGREGGITVMRRNNKIENTFLHADLFSQKLQSSEQCSLQLDNQATSSRKNA
ncbi:unnamed protein product, partial [Sphagnum balticum]